MQPRVGVLATDAKEAFWGQTSRAAELAENGVFVVLSQFSPQGDVGLELQRAVRSLASDLVESGTHLGVLDILNLRRNVYAHLLVQQLVFGASADDMSSRRACSSSTGEVSLACACTKVSWVNKRDLGVDLPL